MISVRRNSDLSSEIICRSQRDDAERHVESIESVYHFVDGSVAAGGNHDVHPALRRRRGNRERFSGLERRVRLDMMSLVANLAHEVSNVGAVGARSVDDQYDVLGSHALD